MMFSANDVILTTSDFSATNVEFPDFSTFRTVATMQQVTEIIRHWVPCHGTTNRKNPKAKCASSIL